MNKYKNLSPAVLAKKQAALLGQKDKIMAQLAIEDPFFAYTPSDGTISEAGKAFLREYLKEEDIPQILDSQLDAHLCVAPMIFVTGGNQSGKTTWEAIEDYIAVTGEVPFSMRNKYPKEKLPTEWPMACRTVGVSDKQLHNTVLRWYRHWAPRNHLKNGRWDDSYISKYDTLLLYKDPSGKEQIGYIEFMNNRQDVDVFQGPPLNKLSYDEEPEEEIRKENLMRFVTTKPRESFAFTPTKGLSWTAPLITLGEDENNQRVGVFKLCSVTNPKANLDALREILDELPTYDEIKMRLLGEIVSLSGLVYGNLFKESIHVVPPDIIYKNGKIDHEKYLVYRGLDPHLVKPSVCVEVAVDREGFEYVVGCCSLEEDTEDVKRILAERARTRSYRLAKTKCDTSANSTITALSGRNIYRELGRGKNAIPALETSEKYTGSIHAGVDDIKKGLKIIESVGVPRIRILDLPENKPLIQAMKMLERETYANEDKKGKKDRIAEGRWDAHAAFRYCHQIKMRWHSKQIYIPPHEFYDEAACA